MPFLNGVYKRLQSWRARAAAGAPISPVEFDADGDDEAAALSLTLLRDGSSVPTADLPMALHSLTGIRQAVAAGEPVEFAQWQAGSGSAFNLLHNASFTVNQRGVAGTVTLAAGAYGHDRWKAGASGCTYSFAQTGADFTINVTAGSLVQVVGAFDIDAKSYTLSNQGTAKGRLYQGGSAGAPALAACPVMTANALSAGAPTFVEFGVGTILQPQLEVGATAHTFVRRPLSLDAVLCQGYFENVPFAFFFDSAQVSPRLPFVFKTTKLSAPSVTVALSTSIGVSGTSVSNITAESMAITFNASGSSVAAIGNATVSCEP